MDGPVRWTIPRTHIRARLKIVLPMLLVLIAGGFFVEELFEAVLIFVIFGGLLVGLTIYAFTARDRRYELRDDGYIERVGRRAPRRRRWSEFAGYQTHAEASAGRTRHLVQEASATLGETYVLRSRGFWSWDATLPTTSDVTPIVLAQIQSRLPHRPGHHFNGPVILIVVGAMLLVIATVVIGIVVESK